MKVVLNLSHDQYKMLLTALLLLSGPDAAEILRQAIASDPAEDGPEVAILSVDRDVL